MQQNGLKSMLYRFQYTFTDIECVFNCMSNCRNLGQLGEGQFGVVTRAMWKPSVADQETEVAVKSLNTGANENDKLRFLQEAAIMCQFNHKNVIKLYGVVT